ncbi:MAG TPA: adenylyl-sulfate kinase, partial [Marmoricola sp.]|nr:adenylyl-sulfate kinase [Marmoricola sp.]
MPLPQFYPTPRELDDLELLLAGAYQPRDRFDQVVTLSVPEILDQTAGFELVDPEGLPLARVAPDGSLTRLAM